MKVKTDFVPDDEVGFLTVGKEYEMISALRGANGWGGFIINDQGYKIFIITNRCSFLSGKDWTIIKEGTMKVKTDFVPDDELHTLTVGKEYDMINPERGASGWGGDIINDQGHSIFIVTEGCAFLSERDWTVTEY